MVVCRAKMGLLSQSHNIFRTVNALHKVCILSLAIINYVVIIYAILGFATYCPPVDDLWCWSLYIVWRFGHAKIGDQNCAKSSTCDSGFGYSDRYSTKWSGRGAIRYFYLLIFNADLFLANISLSSAEELATNLTLADLPPPFPRHGHKREIAHFVRSRKCVLGALKVDF